MPEEHNDTSGDKQTSGQQTAGTTQGNGLEKPHQPTGHDLLVLQLLAQNADREVRDSIRNQDNDISPSLDASDNMASFMHKDSVWKTTHSAVSATLRHTSKSVVRLGAAIKVLGTSIDSKEVAPALCMELLNSVHAELSAACAKGSLACGSAHAANSFAADVHNPLHRISCQNTAFQQYSDAFKDRDEYKSALAGAPGFQTFFTVNQQVLSKVPKPRQQSFHGPNQQSYGGRGGGRHNSNPRFTPYQQFPAPAPPPAPGGFPNAGPSAPGGYYPQSYGRGRGRGRG